MVRLSRVFRALGPALPVVFETNFTDTNSKQNRRDSGQESIYMLIYYF